MSGERTTAIYDATALPEAPVVIAEWQASVDRLANALCEVVAYRQLVDALRERFTNRRAALAVDERIDGKNEAQRSAQLTLLLLDDPQCQETERALIEAERELDLADAKVKTLEARLSFHKATLAYLTSHDRIGMGGAVAAPVLPGPSPDLPEACRMQRCGYLEYLSHNDGSQQDLSHAAYHEVERQSAQHHASCTHNWEKNGACRICVDFERRLRA